MEKLVVIKNETGLHARPAGMFVKKASEFTSTVEVNSDAFFTNIPAGLACNPVSFFITSTFSISQPPDNLKYYKVFS